MRRVVRRMRLEVSVERAFAGCVALLENPDHGRGILARVCSPSPPRAGSEVVTTVMGRDGVERDQRSRVTELDPPRTLTTEAVDATPSLRTSLEVAADGSGALVTFVSEVGIGVSGRSGALLDRLLYGRGQRRAAAATLRRVRELCGGS